MDSMDPSLIRQQAIDKDVFFNWAAEWGIGWVVMDRNRASVVLDHAVRALLGEPWLAQGHLVAWRIDPVTAVGRGAPPSLSTKPALFASGARE